MKYSLPLLLASTALASDVLTLNQASFDQLLVDTPLALVEFFAPWCGHCKNLAPEYELAATELKNKAGIAIAKVDCTEEVDLCAKEGVQGYPTLNLYRGKGNVAAYAGARKADAIVSYMTKQSLPAVSELTAETFDAFSKSDKVVAISFVDKDDTASASTFSDVANVLRDDFLFGTVADADVAKLQGVVAPALVVYKTFDDGKDVFDGKFDTEKIKDFVKSASIPLLGEIGPDTYQSYMSSGLPLGYLFVEKDEDKIELSKFVSKLAADYKGKINFATIDAKAFGGHAENLNLKQTWPAFAIQDTVKQTKFPFPQEDEITEKTLKKFLSDFASGKVKPSVKSEPIPESQPDAVITVVRDSYDSIILDDDKDVLIEFYAPWCGHCKNLAPNYEILAQSYASSKDKLVIAKIDATANDVPDEIKGFPTIKMYAAGKKDSPIEYTGDRSIESLAEFIKTEGTHKIEASESSDVDMEDATETLGVAAAAASKVVELAKDAINDGDDVAAKDEL
ncbi:Protein disulfide-isomerase [Taphrina deformans PYCC 5710]|uniref:Protein disulfide-isomerase n=1 Tax=Taphrina deformans (strain PYCC 5710 / ATCC 11124 / CBS 356.35 / IMI 108563 / JCM 9778 / NBRC 8474) TaxID=1097556 RepID=R4XAT8_TAPDE|nr:Protein disulfide-isomerase [Taphrina deformans PYCC 5710]|eukprot:CCG82974.1 Protein disulfide-isomerase [Taphrina deformans PYCC 5710]